MAAQSLHQTQGGSNLYREIVALRPEWAGAISRT
jgi:hypothetical protein